MKLLTLVGLLAAAVAASPIALEEGIQLGEIDASIEKRQGVGSTATELENGPCRAITFIFARGSTEAGNFVRLHNLPQPDGYATNITQGSSVGPPTCNQLKSAYGSSNVACQGVGGAYRATLAANSLPGGTTSGAIAEAQRLFNLANTKCPNTRITAGGYR